MSILNDIEKIFSQEDPHTTRPIWVDELLQELRDIKSLLSTKPSTENRQEYFEYIKTFKELMRSNDGGIKMFSIDQHRYYFDKNLLCDFETGRFVSREKAFYIYKKIYANRDAYAIIPNENNVI